MVYIKRWLFAANHARNMRRLIKSSNCTLTEIDFQPYYFSGHLLHQQKASSPSCWRAHKVLTSPLTTKWFRWFNMARSSGVWDCRLFRPARCSHTLPGKSIYVPSVSSELRATLYWHKSFPVECSNCISFLEKYHGPLRRFFTIIYCGTLDHAD